MNTRRNGEPSVDFPWHELDRGNPLEAELSEATPKREVESVTAARLLYHIIIMGGINPEQTMIWINAFLFTMGIHPNQNQSGEKIALGLCVTKAEWFRRVSRIRRTLKARGLFLPKITGQFSENGKKSVSKSAKKFWKNKGGKPMMMIPVATEKMNWIAEWSDRLDFGSLSAMQRTELKTMLRPVVEIHNKL